MIIIHIYVDDILIIGLVSMKIAQVICQLNTIFSLKNLGQVSYFLGIEILKIDSFLYLYQRNYIYELLKRQKLIDDKPLPTPISFGDCISHFDAITIDYPV